MKPFVLIVVTGLTFGVSLLAQTPSPTPLDAEAEKRRADTLQERYNTYANYARYAEANSKLPPSPKGEDRVVFIGDSITEGWKLAEAFPGKPYINRGIGGQTTSQMLIRFRQDVIALKPSAVVILAGTNDIAGYTGPILPDAIADNLESMVELAQASGIGVVLASVISTNDYKKTPQGNPIIQTVRRPPAQIRAVNERIKKICAEHKIVFLDYYSAMADDKGFLKEELSYDGLHATPQIWEIMASIAAPAIAAALKGKQKK